MVFPFAPNGSGGKDLIKNRGEVQIKSEPDTLLMHRYYAHRLIRKNRIRSEQVSIMLTINKNKKYN